MKANAKEESLAIPISVRAAVDERDGLCCRVCGKYLGDRRALHHVIYGGDARGMGGRRIHNVEEIATVCWLAGDPAQGIQPCHDRVHADKARYQPLLLEVLQTSGLTVLQVQRWQQGERR